MSTLTRKEKLDLVLSLCENHGFTAYEIGKATGLDISGVHRILTGEVVNPRTKTLNSILKYIESHVSGKKIRGHPNYQEQPEQLAELHEPGNHIKIGESLNRLEGMIKNGHSIIADGIAELLLDTDEILDTQKEHTQLFYRLTTIIENRRTKRSKP